MCRLATTGERNLAVLKLFTMDAPEWTVDAAAKALGVSPSTAYEYFRSLVNARLLVAFKTGRYVIGPAVIELDRQVRRLDPLIRGASPAMSALAAVPGMNATVLLCRLYGPTVMCVDQRTSAMLDQALPVSFERGRPMPLFRGAASKTILANLPPRALRRHFEQSGQAIREAGLGDDWKTFNTNLRRLRQKGVCVTYGEIDAGVVGISSPIFTPEGDILGSIGLVVPQTLIAGDEARLSDLSDRVIQSGLTVTQALRTDNV